MLALLGYGEATRRQHFDGLSDSVVIQALEPLLRALVAPLDLGLRHATRREERMDSLEKALLLSLSGLGDGGKLFGERLERSFLGASGLLVE